MGVITPKMIFISRRPCRPRQTLWQERPCLVPEPFGRVWRDG
jgi:hypothetical protein